MPLLLLLLLLAQTTNYDSEGRIDRFLDLRGMMTERLNKIKETLELVKSLEKVPGSNPKELISAQSQVRTEMTALNDEWKELDQLYRNEAKKKRSKFTPEEMSARKSMLTTLQKEIQAIKDMQRAGFVKGYQAIQMSSMEESEIFKGGSGGGKHYTDDYDGGGRGPVVGKSNNYMTDQDRQALQMIREKDHEIDTEIMNIGEGVDALHELARVANEELKMQNKMLDTLERKIDNVHEHVTTINEKLKKTLEEARKSDKICVDIICILLLVGMVIVLVKLTKSM